MILLKRIYLYIYCMSIPKALLMILSAVGVFMLLRRKLHSKKAWRCCIGTIILLWVTAIVVYTLILRNQAAGSDSLSWLPFHSYLSLLRGANIEVLRMNFMNTVLFYPLGLLGSELLPRDWTLKKRLIFAAYFALVFSCSIEIIQFVSRRGYAEMDDIIHNTAGTCLGVLTAGHHAEPAKREVGCNE